MTEKTDNQKDETLDAFTHRAHQTLHKRNMAEFLQVKLDETITTRKRYLKPGRPSPNSPFVTETRSHFSLTIHRNETALATARQLAGWRIHVSNVSSHDKLYHTLATSAHQMFDTARQKEKLTILSKLHLDKDAIAQANSMRKWRRVYRKLFIYNLSVCLLTVLYTIKGCIK